MKRPVTLLLVATLLASGAAYAKNDKERFADRVAHKAMRTDEARSDLRRQRAEQHRRDDSRHDRNPGRNDHGRDRGNDHRYDHRNDHRNDRPGHDRYDDRRHDWDRRDDRRSHGGWDRPRSDWNHHPNYWDNRRHDRRDYARYRYHYGVYHAPRGYYHRIWHRGDRLPRGWYGSSYVVYDWRPYRLYAPPYGYHWVRVGNDVVLTALATGIVLDVLYDIWY
jgi:Ni/Co efflux regulator RcnB